MAMPMAVLAAGCAFIGLAPLAVAPMLERGNAAWAPELAARATPLADAAPLRQLSFVGVSLIALVALGGLAFGRLGRFGSAARAVRAPTWDCGYAAPSARMQYTSSSFAESLVALFSWALRPHGRLPSPVGPFPRTETFASHVPDSMLDRVVLPASRAATRALSWFRWVQLGRVHVYLAYILAAIFLLLLRR